MMLAAEFRAEAQAPTTQKSPLMQALLHGVADDWDAGGVTRDVLGPFAEEPANARLPHRFAAALHQLVLTRDAPALALHYPSVGGFAPPAALWPAALRVLENQGPEVTALTALPHQANDVLGCPQLLKDLLDIYGMTRKPLQLLEIGAVAGLNLALDRYRYGEVFGPMSSPCRLPDPGLPADVELVIAGRAGCDPYPLDPTSAEGRLRLTASVFGDQLAAFERLRGALAVAVSFRVPIEQAPPQEWLARQAAIPGAVPVVICNGMLEPGLFPGAVLSGGAAGGQLGDE